MSATKSKNKINRKAKAPAAKAPVLESIVNNAPRTFTDADFPVGSVACQGDLYFVRIGSFPKSAKPRANRQLAEGNTQGSRHIVSIGAVYDCDSGEVSKIVNSLLKKLDLQARYVGPVFGTIDDKADVTHPEHGHHLFRGEMVLATIFQRNLDAEQREQRSID